MSTKTPLGQNGHEYIQAQEEHEKRPSHAGDDGRDHQDAVIGAVQEDGNQDGQSEVESSPGRVPESGLGIEIAHHHSKKEMAGDGADGTDKAYAHPGVDIPEQIADVLERGEAHPDADGIDNPVHVLVEIRVVSQQQPQERNGYQQGRQRGQGSFLYLSFR